MIPTPTFPPLIALSRTTSVSRRRRLGSAVCAGSETAHTEATIPEKTTCLSEDAMADGRIEVLQLTGHELNNARFQRSDDAVLFEIPEWYRLLVGEVIPVVTASNCTFADRKKPFTGIALCRRHRRITLRKQRALFLTWGVGMRRFLGVLCGAAALACSENAPSSPKPFISLASLLGAEASANNSAAPLVYNTQMRSELESPACNSESKGHAQIKVGQDGTIHSHVTINNKR